MRFFLRFRLEFVVVVLAVGTILAAADLIVGPEGATLVNRVWLVAVNAIVVPFSYYGMRGILGLQLKLHGPKSWIRKAAAFFFWFFLLGSVLILFRSPFVVGLEPLTVPFCGAASFALGALAAYRAVQKRLRDLNVGVAV